jgi:carboxypeptidase Taq
MDTKALNDLLMEIKKISSITAVLHWDQETYMPNGSGNIRAEQLSYLSGLAHKLHTGDSFRAELEKLVDMETGEPRITSINDEMRRYLYLTWKDYRDSAALPPEFVQELTFHAAKSQQVWAKARQDNDYKSFAPFLEKMVEYKKREADYYGYNTTPYDALLDKYEPAMTSEKVTVLFDEMRDRLVKLVKDIKNSGQKIDETPLKQSFDVDKQWKFGLKIAGDMGFDFEKGRQDRSAHPFTTGFHPTDVRITTRLSENNFKMALLATIHETGHALYEQGLQVEDFGTTFGDAVSYGFHESQSRLWENQVGRGRHFWKHYFPILQKYFPEPLKGIDMEQFYKMLNVVTPSLNRVESDEVTYSLHIMLRFEIEKMLINDNQPVNELPEIWNAKMEEYLGIRPSDDKDGVLQDIHWSMGAFGYFPTYALGNLYSAPIMEQAQRDIENLHNKIQEGELLPLRQWLKENVHSKGRRLFVEELIREITGSPLSAKPFLDYLETKYRDIYGI